ncbi:Pectinesterase 2 [Morus notabilis]|uniref:Pectinesterase n=2 Tax=Morus notabilis TaxID=981085 RepID=W9R0V6_9ROSA|nr:Pectinesterase 2 [Morus notabilis]
MIRIKPGRYKEHVEIESDLTYISLIGDDVTTTIIIFDRSNGSGFKTNETGTLSVMGQGFVAKSLTIENSTGPQNHQAAALYNTADQSAFYNCIFLGYQDTLYAKENRQFYKDCKIYGTVDFIFGHAKAVFQDCHIYARPETLITITAQNRASDSEVNGFSFQGCHVEATLGLTPPQRANLIVFLGRPWDRYSTVIFMQSIFDDIVDPQGWTEWPGVSVDHLYYAEYDNSGLGADTSKRVNWKGYHVSRSGWKLIGLRWPSLLMGITGF